MSRKRFNDDDFDGLPPRKRYYSLGKLCYLLQRSPAQIERATWEDKIVPCHSVDDIVYFDGTALEKLSKKFSDD